MSWWLVHAWRFIDLSRASLACLQQPFTAELPVMTRALIEDVGCIHYESKHLAAKWAEAKGLPDGVDRPWDLRELLDPELTQASYGSRLKWLEKKTPSAKSILTYLDHLARATGNQELPGWYDLLTDAAHPAFASRTVQSSQLSIHNSGAVWQREYSRRTVRPRFDGDIDFTIVRTAADAALQCTSIGIDLLRQSLAVVDDFGLTTGAATMTERAYWRNLRPSSGNRPCPCGRGSWRKCGHYWNSHAPSISISPD